MDDKIANVVISELCNIHKMFPRIATNIELLWGSEEGHNYLISLLNKNREIRIGFPRIIFASLINLYATHIEYKGDYNNPLLLTRANIKLTY